ncbi:hypothetical protein EDB86DRAFT_469024 [Lactarius hatsudake]|nr:hypothetical protein EDB86DRAFT_469024 [Lactarius hatsudake]
MQPKPVIVETKNPIAAYNSSHGCACRHRRPRVGLGLRDSFLVILFFNLLFAIPPAYSTCEYGYTTRFVVVMVLSWKISTWDPKLGLRQLCSTRYTFGYYGVVVPSMLSVFGLIGFAVLNSIVGGQVLASVGNVSWTAVIVVVSVIYLFISFCGPKVFSWFERVVWIFVILPVVFIIAACVSGKHFADAKATLPSTAS